MLGWIRDSRPSCFAVASDPMLNEQADSAASTAQQAHWDKPLQEVGFESSSLLYSMS